MFLFCSYLKCWHNSRARARRAVAIETGLLQLQGQGNRDRRATEQRESGTDPLAVFRNLLNHNKPGQSKRKLDAPNFEDAVKDGQSRSQNPTVELSRRFLHLARLDGEILDRIERYEVTLWRQTAQTMLMLNTLRKVPRFYGRTNFGSTIRSL